MLDSTTYDIDEEYERVTDRLDDLADKQIELEEQIIEASAEGEDPPSHLAEERQEVVDEANRLDKDRLALAWARDPDTEIAPIDEVEIAALTAGEMAEVNDRTDAVRDLKREQWGVVSDMSNAEQVHFAAAVLEDAPFLDDDADFEATLDALNQDAIVRPQFVKWLARRGREEFEPDVEGKSYAERVAAKRTTRSAGSATAEQS